MDPWRTAIATSDATNIWVRGHAVTSLMREATFTDTIVLLHLGRLPSPGERRLLDAVLIGVADHGSGAPSCATARLAASGNRSSISSAVAAGILAIGDDHGGAGSNCMELIAAGPGAAKSEGLTPADAAKRTVEAAVRDKRRLPGLGHRVHTTDPRVKVLFDMARAEGVAGDGILFMEALEAEARDADQAAADEHRRRAGRHPPRPRLHAAGRPVPLHRRTCRRADGGSRRGVRPGKADAHQDPRGLRRRPADPEQTSERTQ